jgi:hypothetical protein
MNLQQICRKYHISDSYLNAKDDALLICALSIDELIFKVETHVAKEELIDDLKKVAEFMRDVKNSNI